MFVNVQELKKDYMSRHLLNIMYRYLLTKTFKKTQINIGFYKKIFVMAVSNNYDYHPIIKL